MNINVDILDSYDIVATEADISIAEYAMESAQFEIDNGNDNFIPIYEAAETSADKSNATFFQKLKKKISDFCKAAISKIRNILSAITNRMRMRKSIKTDNKLASIDKDKTIHPSAFDLLIILAANPQGGQPTVAEGINADIPSLFREFKTNVYRIIINPKREVARLELAKIETFMIELPDIVVKTSSKKIGDVTFSVAQVRMLLSDCIKYLQLLMDMVPTAEAAASQARNEGIDVTSGRSAVAKLISIMTRYVNAYYKALMRVSKSLITGREIGIGTVNIADLANNGKDK